MAVDIELASSLEPTSDLSQLALGDAIPVKSAKVSKSKPKKKTPAQIEAALISRLACLPSACSTPLAPTPTHHLPPFHLLAPSFRSSLHTFLTPSCRSHPTLSTPRLCLRPVHQDDLQAIGRIKREPSVLKTQLYSAPNDQELRDAFLARYVRAQMPRVASGIQYGSESGGKCREDYVWAITVKEGTGVKLGNAAGVRLQSRIKDTSGYVGNIALHLTASPSAQLLPRSKKVYTLPTLDQTTSSSLVGDMFYELHPQLWGQGIMSEAFREVLRYAFEVVGCTEVTANPTTNNPASLKLCLSNGMRHTHTAKDNPFRRPEAFHRITRKEWFARNRGGEVRGVQEGHLGCRWCLRSLEVVYAAASPDTDEKGGEETDGGKKDDGQTGHPENKDEEGQEAVQAIKVHRCTGCQWVAFCSAECRVAEWSMAGGHQDQCDKRP